MSETRLPSGEERAAAPQLAKAVRVRHSSLGEHEVLDHSCHGIESYPVKPALAVDNESTGADEAVERVVMQMNALCKTATMTFALAVGKLVIVHLYNGSLDRWRNRNPKKDKSLRKLARHPHLSMSPAALYRSVAIFEICERLGIRSWKHVSTAHIRLVLPLPLCEQERLLRAVEDSKWPANRLDTEIAELARRDGFERAERGGRKRKSRLEAQMQNVHRIVAKLEQSIKSQDEAAPIDASPDSVRKAIHVLRRAAEACVTLERRIERSVVAEAASSRILV